MQRSIWLKNRREIERLTSGKPPACAIKPASMCGVVGIIGTRDASREAFLGLTVLQHRGQDAAGILSYDDQDSPTAGARGFHRVKNIGLVESVFTREGVQSLTGDMAIGHARYSTAGRGELHEVQPFLINYPYGIGLVHNGNVINTQELKEDLQNRSRRHLLTSSDSEIILNLFAENLAKRAGDNVPEGELSFDSICESVGDVFKRVQGSYSIVTLIAGEGMIAFRDPHGIRPLVWGKRAAKRNGESVTAHLVASESVVLGFLGYEKVRDLKPGEVLFVNRKGEAFTRVLDGRTARPCMFEWVYFASPESELDGQPVYASRIHLGHSLARLIQREIDVGAIKPDIIVPVPETSRIAAIAISEDLGIPYREVLIKNRYIKRTFILDSQEKRQQAVNLKLSPVRSEIEGKRVLLVDDSIVRGTTSKKIIELVRAAGAAEVYFVSTCPPIKHPCYYGIDFPSGSELIGSGRTHAEITAALGADAVIYQDLPGLKASVGGGEPCMACLSGEYPTDTSAAGGFAASRSKDRATQQARKEGA